MVPELADNAANCSSKENCINAMAEELNSLSGSNAFSAVPILEQRRIFTGRWLFALQRNSKRNLIHYKARLVGKGFSQVRGVDFGDVFSPVVRVETMRFLLSYLAVNDL